jgi:hypothetical protein
MQGVEQLVWMTGSWQCEVRGGIWQEHWAEPRAGTMQGMARHFKDDETGFMEFLSIESSDHGLTLWVIIGAPSKGEKTPASFRLTQMDGQRAVFEDPNRDFPNKVTYSKAGAEGMQCLVQGVKNGVDITEEFNFQRLSSAGI